jgi:SOS-response transcriptional repressor LexA
MRAMNLSSVSAVAEHIENLVARGALKKIPGAARSLEIIEEAPPSETALLFATKIAELERSGHSTDVAALRHAAELLNVLI